MWAGQSCKRWGMYQAGKKRQRRGMQKENGRQESIPSSKSGEAEMVTPTPEDISKERKLRTVGDMWN